VTETTTWRTGERYPRYRTGPALDNDGSAMVCWHCPACGESWLDDGMADTLVPSHKTPDTRAERLAMPLARHVVRDLAIEHADCI
jgi:hypothetical protein